MSMSLLSMVRSNTGKMADLLMRARTWRIHPPLLSLLGRFRQGKLSDMGGSFQGRREESEINVIWSISVKEVVLSDFSPWSYSHLQFVLRKGNLSLESSLVLHKPLMLADRSEGVLLWNETLEVHATDGQEEKIVLELRGCTLDGESGGRERGESMLVGRVDLLEGMDGALCERMAALVSNSSSSPGDEGRDVNVNRWYNLPSVRLSRFSMTIALRLLAQVVTWYSRIKVFDVPSEQVS